MLHVRTLTALCWEEYSGTQCHLSSIEGKRRGWVRVAAFSEADCFHAYVVHKEGGCVLVITFCVLGCSLDVATYFRDLISLRKTALHERSWEREARELTAGADAYEGEGGW